MEVNNYIITYDQKAYEFSEDVSVKEAAAVCAPELYAEVIAARINGKLFEAGRHIDRSGEISFISKYDPIGHMIYTRTALFILSKSIFDLLGKSAMTGFQVHFTIANGYYCEIDDTVCNTEAFCLELKSHMQSLIDRNLLITKQTKRKDEAVTYFQALGLYDKCHILKYRNSSFINLYSLENYMDYNYGYLADATGIIDLFDIQPYQQGFVLVLPRRRQPKELMPFQAADKLFKTLYLKTLWGRKMNVQDISDLNDMVAQQKINDLILVQEALQEKKIAEISSAIIETGKRIVLIAGPSSSGKTTFSHRLSIQLRAEGMRSHPIPVDDYFVNRVDTPKDEEGNLNYESLHAIDTKLLNEHLHRLLSGDTVELPTYNFVTGMREYRGRTLQIGPEDILVIEGIHALNDEMTYSIDVDDKFKIYISALTALNIDKHNRISTTDGRLIRRMVRDAATRGADAQKTIAMWNSVGRGEEENIYPYQENADVMFNSSLIYELSAIKQYAVPLLHNVPEDSPEYDEARRLLKFLNYVLSIDDRMIPRNSIIREFIGNSCFNV